MYKNILVPTDGSPFAFKAKLTPVAALIFRGNGYIPGCFPWSSQPFASRRLTHTSAREPYCSSQANTGLPCASATNDGFREDPVFVWLTFSTVPQPFPSHRR